MHHSKQTDVFLKVHLSFVRCHVSKSILFVFLSEIKYSFNQDDIDTMSCGQVLILMPNTTHWERIFFCVRDIHITCIEARQCEMLLWS